MNEDDLNRMEKGIQRAFDSFEASALVYVEPFADMLKDNPDKAIDMIFSVYNRTLDDAYTDDEGRNVRAFIESIAGGPHEAIPSAVYNAVGEVYPYLERPQKDRALEGVLNILDGNSDKDVRWSHTPFIREQLLLSDITICRPHYWPTILGEGKRLVNEYSSFEELEEDVIDEEGLFRRDKVDSDFLVATALMCNKCSNWGDNYIEVANAKFLERVFKGIVGIEFSKVSPEKLEERINEFLREWPEEFCRRLGSFLEERDWVDYRKFGR